MDEAPAAGAKCSLLAGLLDHCWSTMAWSSRRVLLARASKSHGPACPTIHILDNVLLAGDGSGNLGVGCVEGANMLRYHLRPLNRKGLDSSEWARTPAAAATAVAAATTAASETHAGFKAVTVL